MPFPNQGGLDGKLSQQILAIKIKYQRLKIKATAVFSQLQQ